MEVYERPDIPPRNEVDRTGEVRTPNVMTDEEIARMRPGVANAVRSLRERMPAIRPNGIFQHPADWTQEELDFIADGLKMNVPIYTIAKMVHCEKHCLSRLIRNTPELLELKNEQHENILDEAEYQADRLAKQGNASMVMYILGTLGRKRGWSQQGDVGEADGSAPSRIVMGVIPDEDVKTAEAVVASKRAPGEKDPNAINSLLVDPVQMQAVKDVVAEGVKEEMKRAGLGETIEVQGKSSSPYAGESVADAAAHEGYDQYASMGGFGNYGGFGGDDGFGMADPFGDGANSMFAQ